MKKEADVLFRQGMELLKNGDYKRAEEVFPRARDIAGKELL